MGDPSGDSVRYSVTVTEGVLRRIAASVLWFNMVRAPGLLAWPLVAVITIVAVVFVFLATGWVVALYAVIAVSGIYSVVARPIMLYLQLYRRLADDTPPGDYWSLFSDDEALVSGPRRRRRIRYERVAWIAHRPGCVVIASEESGRYVAYADKLFPSDRVDEILAHIATRHVE